MRSLGIVGLLLFFVACGGASADPVPSEEQDVTKAKLDANVVKLVGRAECAVGNGSHQTVRFVPASFDPAQALAALKTRDRERGCPGRVYSASKESGAKAFVDFLKDPDGSFRDQCESSEENANVDALKKDLRDLATDPTNRAVFSSLHDDKKKDDPVHCAYFDFQVFRADGTVAKFDFDWSD